MVATRKRRVIEANEDEEDKSETIDGSGETSIGDKKMEESGNTTSLVDRLKRRAARSAEISKHKNKRKKLQTEDNDTNSPNKSPKSSGTVIQEKSIPKKPKKNTIIPKKTDGVKTKMGSNVEQQTPSLLSGMKKPPLPKADDIKSKTPSLLSEMKKPPLPKADDTKNISVSNKGGYNTSRNKTWQKTSSWGSHNSGVSPGQTPNSPQMMSPVNITSTPPPNTANTTNTFGQLDPVAPGIKNEGEDTGKFGSGLRRMVFDGLRDLCKDVFKVPPERHGNDLFASFLRHKDLNQTSETNVTSIDSNDTKSLQYDFFDVDERTGTITLQPKIPIFPEDFPAGGKREWPLSWWGIIDPSIEEGKNGDKEGSEINSGTRANPKTRRDRPGARLSGGKEGREDRNRHDISRSADIRKRQSRDVHEDERRHYRNYSPQEIRREMSVYDHYDGNRGSYPPQPHANDYGRHHHERPASDHYSHSRDPQFNATGPRDEPPFSSRPFSRNSPRQGDFIGRDRRPPPRDYSHRDSYGSQGHGQVESFDGRREYRERIDDGRRVRRR